MKVAMITGGLQRFNSFFVDTVNLLKDVTEINFYMYMWKQGNTSESEFISNSQELNVEYIKKISPIIKSVNVIIVDEPNSFIVPIELSNTPTPQGVDTDYFERIYKQHYSLHKAFQIYSEDIINHDCIIRFRSDCRLDKEIFLKDFNLNEGIYTPNNTKVSLTDLYPKLCDQFAIGNFKNMQIYFNNYNNILNNILTGCPINQETLLSCHLTKNNIKINYGDFFYDIKNRPLVRGY